MASSSSHSTPRDKLPTVVHNLGEETAAGPQDNTHAQADLIPTNLAHYKIQHKLGQGGMGWVVLAEDTKLSRKVALKVMRGRLAADKESRERFKREASAAAQLRHDNVVTIYQVDEDSGVPFFAMELLEGGTLQQRLEYPRPLSIGAAVRIAREIAQGLQVAHERGLIHRDIKPANIWLESPRGRVKILDFGLARQVDVKSGLTHSGEIVGTPHFMSPEQARGRANDPRTDLFSLGCVLYRMTTGKLPFVGESLLATLTAIAVDKPTPVIRLNPQVPHALADLIERLLEKDPAGRPASAGEVIEELTTIERDLAPGNRSGFSIDVPPAILIHTEPKSAASKTAESTTPAPRAAKFSWSAARPSPRQAWRPWRNAVAFGLLMFLGLVLSAVLWSLVNYRAPSAGAIGQHSDSSDLRGVTPLEKSFAASKIAAEWALANGGPTARVHVQIEGQTGSIPIADSTRLPSIPYSLVGLEFRGSRAIASADLSKLAGIATLSELDLSYTGIDDQGLALLDGLGALTSLKLEGTAVSDAGIESVVRSCPMLKRLDVGKTACTAGVVPALAPLHQLEVLSLVRVPVGDAQLSQLAAHVDLKMIDLQESQVTGQGLRALTVLSRLVNLVLNDTNVGDEGAAQLAKCIQLEFLALNNCQLTDSGVQQLASLPRLGWLEIRDNKLLRDEGLNELGKSQSLKRLVVTNGNFSHEAREGLQKRLPGCEIKLVDAVLP